MKRLKYQNSLIVKDTDMLDEAAYEVEKALYLNSED